jgi:release factor glutamine methyltransferase
MADPLCLADLQGSAVQELRAAGIDNADTDAAILLAEALRCDRLALLRRGRDVVDPAVAEKFRAMLRARAAGRPVSRILGRREFWSLPLNISDDVLDPRSDSETLIQAVLRECEDHSQALQILDLGTGSGCLLLALLSEYPGARGLGVDISPAAVALASANAAELDLQARAHFTVADWADGIEGEFDVVIANPPYIARAEIETLAPEVRLHDPLLALDGGGDGLAAYRVLVPALPALLRPGGLAVLECGLGQAAKVSGLLGAAALTVIKVQKDLSGVERCLSARMAV